MRTAGRRVGVLLTAALLAAGPPPAPAGAAPPDAAPDGAVPAWSPGVPTGPGGTVPVARLVQLPGGLSGPETVVSNNPETVTGTGWLMLHSRATGAGGRAYPVRGDVPLYLYHQNGTDQTRWLHVLVANPGPEPVRVSGVGSMYTNDQVRLEPDPARRAGTGPSYQVARDWLDIEADWRSPRASVRFGVLTVPPRTAVQAVVARMNPRNLIDGRIRVTVDGGGAYLYTVLTADGSAATAIDHSQRDDAAAPGNVQPEDPATGEPGRMSGVYAHSAWTTTAAQPVDVPAAPAHLGYALDTIVYNRADLDQSAPAVAVPVTSARRSHGNYGFRYRVEFALRNPDPAAARTVRLSFGHGLAAGADGGETTWNGPVRVTDAAGTRTDVLGTRPTAPRDPGPLGTWTLAPGAAQTVAVELFVPGLAYSNAQLVWESV